MNLQQCVTADYRLLQILSTFYSRAYKEYEEKLKQAREQAEKEKLELVEIWKKELELAKKPWYKFW